MIGDVTERGNTLLKDIGRLKKEIGHIKSIAYKGKISYRSLSGLESECSNLGRRLKKVMGNRELEWRELIDCENHIDYRAHVLSIIEFGIYPCVSTEVFDSPLRKLRYQMGQPMIEEFLKKIDYKWWGFFVFGMATSYKVYTPFRTLVLPRKAMFRSYDWILCLHEMFHFHASITEREISPKRISTEFISSIFENFKEKDVEDTIKYVGNPDFIEQWVNELICDVSATIMGGPSFVHSMNDSILRPTLTEADILKHPPFELRLNVCNKALSTHGFKEFEDETPTMNYLPKYVERVSQIIYNNSDELINLIGQSIRHPYSYKEFITAQKYAKKCLNNPKLLDKFDIIGAFNIAWILIKDGEKKENMDEMLFKHLCPKWKPADEFCVYV